MLVVAFSFVLSGTIAKAQVVVTATAGVTGPTFYTTVGAAFADINAGLPQGAIAVAIQANTIETGPCVLNESGAGAATYTTVTVVPIVDGVTISGATPSGRGLIELNGADNVVIEGDNPNTGGINRNLTIQNTAANTTTYTSVVRIALSTLITSGDNNVVRNCILLGSATGRNTAAATSTTGSEHTTYGILVGGGASTVSNTTAPNAITSVSTTVGTGITAANFTVTNNSINSCARGVAVNGSAVTVVNALTITGNTIGSSTPADPTTVYSRGISVQGFNAAAISGNTFQNIGFYVSTACMGIGIGEVSTGCANAVIENNMVNTVENRNTGTYGAYGINLAGGSNHTVRNNFVQGMNHDMSGGFAFSTTFGVYGIRIGSGTGHNIYYNSVNIFGTRFGTPNSTLLSAALAVVGTGQTGMTIRNNVFSNTLTGGTTSVVAASIYLPSGTSAMNLTLNNNFYYDGTVAGQSGIMQVSTTYSAANLYTSANFIQGSTAPASNMRAYTSTLSAAGTNDDASWASSAAAPFTSNTDLHINLSASNVSDLNARAAVIAGITTDIDGNVRDASTPDIGADEFTIANCSTADGGTIAPSTISRCAGQTLAMTSTGATVAPGITYQWMVGTTSGGPYVNVTGGTGATTVSYTTDPLTAGTYYYVLQTTCTFGPVSDFSNEVTVTVNALPSVAVSPTSGLFCAGSPAITLNATGALGYTWSPSAGLSASTGASVDASPSGSTTYTVTGVDANGCTDTATTSITSGAPPSGVVASASQAPICTGDTIDLMGAAAATVTVLSQDFTSLGAWTITNGPTSPVISNFATRTPPYNNASLQFTNFATPSGGDFLMSDADAGGSGSTTNTVLTSPVFSTVGMTSADLTFENLYQRWNSGDITVALEISTDGGATWTVLRNYLALGNQGVVTANAQVPANESINLSAYLNQPNMRIRYNYVSTWGYYWIIDNIAVSGAATYTYDWTSSPAGFTSALQNPVDVVPAATTDYILTVTNAAGCTADDTVSVTVNPLPTVTANASATTVCDGSPVTLTGSGAATYTWTGGVSDGVAFNPSVTDTYTVTGTDANGCMDSASIMVTVNPLPAVTASSTASAICAGDSVTVMGSGAVTYAWTGGVTDMVAFAPAATDTYTVTGTDANGCEDTATVMVTVNALPVVTASSTASAVCAGDSVTLTGSGAVTYTWTGGVMDSVAFVPAATDTYTVTGTDGNGCMDTATVMVTVNALPAVTANATSTSICTGDSLTLTGSGAVTYTWSGSVSDGVAFVPAATDSYTVTGVDANGCMNMDSVTVAVNALPTVTANATATTVCAGSPVTLTGSGAASYNWTGGVTDGVAFNPSATSTYIVTGIDSNGCSGMDSISITVNPLPAVTYSIAASMICVDDANMTLTAGTPAGGTWSGTGVSGNSFDPSVPGAGMAVITYAYTDSLGCTGTASDSIIVDPCTGIATKGVVADVNIYPNPNEGQFTIQLPAAPASPVQVEIMNELGQLIDAFTMTGTTKEVSISQLEGGVYFVRIISGDVVSVHRVVKQ